MRFIYAFIVCIFALISSLIFCACGAAAETMRAISFIPKNDPVLAMANAWVAEVNGKLGSQLRIHMTPARARRSPAIPTAGHDRSR